MALTKQAFTPSNGFKDATAYPNPTTGPINRAQRMLPHEQMQTYVNTVLTAELDAALGLKADDSAVVKLTGNQNVAGVKTFSSSPVVPTPTTDTQASTKKYVDDENAKDVHLASDQTITGIKTFSSSPIVPDATTATQSASKGQVDAVNSALVTHKTSADHDGRYYTETEIDSKLQGIIVGQIPDRSIVGTKLALKAVSVLEVADNTITEAQMANDMKKQAGGVLPFDIYTAADVLAKIAANSLTESKMANDMKKQSGGVLPFDIYTTADVLSKVGDNYFKPANYGIPQNATGTFTLDLSMANKNLWSETGATITVPSEASVPFPWGTQIVVNNISITAGSITFIPASGVTLVSNGSRRSIDAISVAVLTKISSNYWMLSGALK